MPAMSFSRPVFLQSLFLRTAAIFFAFGLVFAGSAIAGVDEWTTNGPEGGDVLALVVDPQTPTVLYAGSDGAGVFKSTDGGNQWRAVNQGLAEYLRIYGLVIDPQTTTMLYVEGVGRTPSASGVFKSTNGGDSWRRLSEEIRSLPVIDPLTPTTLYSASSKLHRSTDAGESWVEIDTNLPADFYIALLVVDPQTPSTFYASTDDQGLFKSTDGGVHWTLLDNGLDLHRVDTLAIDPQSSSTVYATGNSAHSLYKSIDGGASWTTIHDTEFRSFSDTRILLIDPQDSATIYAGIDSSFEFYIGSVLKSINSGETWTEVLFGPATQTLAMDPANPARIYAGSRRQGVLRSTDAGVTWNRANHGLIASSVFSLAIDPQTRSVLAGTANDGAYRRARGAQHWSGNETGFIGRCILALAADPQSSGTFYAGSELIGGDIYKTIDGGANWVRSGPEVDFGGVYALAVDPETPTTVYAGANGFFKSTDGGGSWTSFANELEGLTVKALAIDPRAPSTLLAGTGNGVFRSTDGGMTWIASNAGLPNPPFDAINVLAIDPRHPDIVYAGGHQGVFRSTDGGVTWDPREGLGETLALAIDPEISTTIYAAGRIGVWRSRDSGGTWTQLDDRWVFALAIDPADASRLYAGSAFSGVIEIQLLADQPVLALHGGRFQVAVEWSDFQGESDRGKVASVLTEGMAEASLQSQDSAVAQFFDGDNWEQLVKVLDGRELNGHFWVFLASATNVGLITTVSDTSCGGFKTYNSPLGQASPAVTDVRAFVDCANPAPPSCVSDTTTFCLGEGGRFRVTTEWTDFAGTRGSGSEASIPGVGLAKSNDSGLFTFFSPDNWELLVKVLDGCGINDHYWVFTAGTTNVEYTVTVTDTESGEVKTYANPLGRAAAAVTDIGAFASCP